MSKSVEEGRRAAFEAYVTSDAGGYLPEHLERDANGDYTIVWEYWGVWNAALDAVEIELPAPIGDDHGGCIHDAATHDSAVSDCRAAIEQTGLGLKVL